MSQRNSSLALPKDKFLGNIKNKQRFICLLSEKLKVKGMTVHHAIDDTDTLVALRSIHIAKDTDVTVIANDTDVILLLCHYFQPHLHDIHVKTTDDV